MTDTEDYEVVEEEAEMTGDEEGLPITFYCDPMPSISVQDALEWTASSAMLRVVSLAVQLVNDDFDCEDLKAQFTLAVEDLNEEERNQADLWEKLRDLEMNARIPYTPIGQGSPIIAETCPECGGSGGEPEPLTFCVECAGSGDRPVKP